MVCQLHQYVCGVERDVRLLKNITDLVAFERFLRLCAGRIGQLLNISSLAEGNTRIPIEIKSGQTVTSDYMKGILFWNKMTQTKGGFVVYGGDMMQNRSSGIRIVPYKEMNTIASDDV